MREKYIEETFPRYFIFGEHPNGNVDVSSANDDIVSNVPRDVAEKLIAQRDAVIDRLVKVSLAFSERCPDEFTKLWYGGKNADA